jgi:cell division protein FtsW
MNRFSAERVRRPSPDFVLMGLLILMLGLGLSMLYSSSYYRAEILYGDSEQFFQRQVIWVILGVIAGAVAMQLPVALIRRSIPVLLLVSLLLMILSFVPGVGAQYLGARRWIFLFGYSFQPSELVKLSLVLYLAFILEKKQDKMDDPVNALLPPLIVVVVFASLIYLQNDFSTALFIGFISLVMFFVARVRIRYFITLGVMTVPLATILLLSKEHRVNRILAFLDPAHDPSDTGYQVLASRTALVHGGLWGQGIGRGTRKFGALPEAHSDFVFAVIGEELGFIGVAAIILLFLVFAYRGFSIAWRCFDTFESLLAFGLTALITFQAMLNMAVVSGLLPATGVPLPFFSQGGSSVFVSLVMCGLLLGISKREARRG